MDTKETIIEMALDLFYAKGYDSVGVQEIAEKAGITKPTLYYYFGSKLGLLHAVLDRYCTRLLKVLEEESHYNGDLPITLYKTASAYSDFAVCNRKFYFFMVALFYYARENEAYKAIHPYIQQMYRIILGIFETAENELGNMNGRQQKFAIGFIGTINYYILFLRETNETDKILITNDQVFDLVHQFMHGIYS